MKKYLYILSFVCFFALASFAQTPNVSGEWTLDKVKSKMDERQAASIERQAASIESQSLKVEQTAKELKVTVMTKQTGDQGAPRADIGAGVNTYLLNGQEFTSENQTQIGPVYTKTKGEIKDGKLNLQSVRTVDAPMGQITITTKEVWELSADGKTLIIKREFESQRGKVNSESVFTKKS